MNVVLRVEGNPWWIRQIETVSPVIELSDKEKFRRLVNAALATPYFSQKDRAAELLEAQTLKDIAVMPLRQVLDARSQFSNPKAEKTRALLRLPLETKGCVVMGKKLQLPKGAVAVEDGMLGRRHLGEARMLAATPAILRRICASVEARTLALPRLCEAVVVLQGLEDGMLYSGERDMLWHCLGVPVFEQWLGLDGELLAWECGAHQGMHFEAGRAELDEVNGELVVTSWFGLRTPVLRIGSGLSAAADHRVCVCGDDRPVLRDFGMRKQILRHEMATA